MHLLSTLPADGSDVEQAVDLGQTPGEIVFLSAADTDLACLAAAAARLPDDCPDASGSPTCCSSATRSRSTSMSSGWWRRPGWSWSACWAGAATGPTAWSRSRPPAPQRGIPLACLPGDDRADPELARALDAAGRGLRPPGALSRPWRRRQCRAGAALRGLAASAATPAWREPVPLPRAGLYRASRPPRIGSAERPLLVFYRALVQSGDLAPIDALLDGLAAAGLAATGLYRRQPQGPGGRHADRRDHRRLCARRWSSMPPPSPSGRSMATAATIRWPPPMRRCCRRARRRQRGRWRAGDARPGSARSRDARRPARGRRPHRRARGLVQGSERARPGDRGRPGTPPAGAGSGRASGRSLPAAWARLRDDAGRRAPHRHRAGQLPEPRRQARQRGRPRRPGQLRRAAASAARPRLSAVAHLPRRRRRADRAARRRPDQRAGRPCGSARSGSRLPLADYRRLFAGLPAIVRSRVRGALGRARGRPASGRRRLRAGAPAAGQRRGRPAAGPRLPHRPRRHLPRARTSRRRTAISPSISGCGTTSARTRSCIWASTATSNGCRARPPPCRPTACPRRCWGRCRTSTRSSSTIPARAPRPSGATAAVIVDHLTPPLTRAESWGELAELEALVDEYHEAARPRSAPAAATCCASASSTAAKRSGLDRDLGIDRDATPATHLAPPRQPPVRGQGAADPRRAARVRPRRRRASQLTDLLVALAARCRAAAARAATPRCCGRWRTICGSAGIRSVPSLAMPGPGRGPPCSPAPAPGAREGDTVERLELLAPAAGRRRARRRSRAGRRRERCWTGSSGALRPAVDGCGAAEIAGPARRARRPARARPGPAAPRRAVGPRCCRPAATSTRSTAAPCRRRRPGSWAGARPSWWSSSICSATAPGRGRWRCRPGAPPTCAPAATTSPRRWR